MERYRIVRKYHRTEDATIISTYHLEELKLIKWKSFLSPALCWEWRPVKKEVYSFGDFYKTDVVFGSLDEALTFKENLERDIPADEVIDQYE